MTVGCDVPAGARVVMHDCNRGLNSGTSGIERVRFCRHHAGEVGIRSGRGNLSRRRGPGRPRWQRCPLNRTKDIVSDRHPVIERNTLRQKIRIQRIGAQRVLTLRQWFVGLVAVADLNRGSALSGVAHAGIVTGTAHGDGGVLGKFAIEIVGGVDHARIGRRPPLRGR